MTMTHTLSRARLVALTLVAIAVCTPVPMQADSRLKDIATLQGISAVPLIGYGLVIGLDKTGDKRQSLAAVQSLANALAKFGVIVAADQMKVENIAAVIVTAELSPYTRSGARVDVTVSSIGDARSLQGGTLVTTPLYGMASGPAGDPIALATGPLSIGGFGGGSGGTSVQVNHLTVGKIPGGGIVQTVPDLVMPSTGSLTFALRDPDFVTASRVAQAINTNLGTPAAKAVDAGNVTLQVPAEFKDALPDLIAKLETLSVQTDVPARVVINERTGTVVIGGDVQISAAAVAHGNLSVRITTKYQVSQPNALSQGGETKVVPQQQVDIREGNAKLAVLPEGTTLEAVVDALNSLGASPRDIVAIVQALKAAGALRAEIIIQ
jgi:flagellar P-ring protein precursor FlgI